MSRTFGVSRVRDDDEVEAVATVYFVPADRIQPEVIKAWAKTRNVKVESTVNVVEASGLVSAIYSLSQTMLTFTQHANRLGRGWLITSIIKITIVRQVFLLLCDFLLKREPGYCQRTDKTLGAIS